jgi:hypothetical protein
MAEVVPEQPHPAAVWLDGHWTWRGRHWAWDRGGWVIPPPDAVYVPWALRYESDGRLLFARSTWRDAAQQALPDPPVLAPAATPPTELTAEPAAVP